MPELEDWQIESKMDALQVNAKRLREIKELKRAITLKNREIKRLESKYMKLRKDKQVDTLRAYIEKLEKQLKKAGLR